MIIHNVTDVPVNAMKIIANVPFGKISAVFYVNMIVSWMYWRTYVFLRYIIMPTLTMEYELRVGKGKGLNGTSVYIALLCTLWLLHMFWLVLIVRMMYTYVKKGIVLDTHETQLVNLKK